MGDSEKHTILAGLLALLLAISACSGETETGSGDQDRRDPARQVAQGREQEVDPLDRVLRAEEEDWGVGQRVDLGDVSIRLFEVRSEDVVYFAPGPGAGVGEEDSAEGEFVAVDFVAQNDGTSRATFEPEVLLGDDSGDRHRRVESVQVPNLIDGGMALEPNQKKASTLFFAVPNGTAPERLGVRVEGEEARFDLLADERDRVPPDDYLRVYHLYFAQRAYEEAYEMYDPTTTQDITLGDWIDFYDPLWGGRFIGLDSLNRVFVAGDEAEFEMDRTFYDRDGDAVDDPVLNAPVLQSMTRSDGTWQLVMGEDLAADIAAEVPDFQPPQPDEPDEPEGTVPETTAPENTAPEATATRNTVPESTAPENAASASASPASEDVP